MLVSVFTVQESAPRLSHVSVTLSPTFTLFALVDNVSVGAATLDELELEELELDATEVLLALEITVGVGEPPLLRHHRRRIAKELMWR